MSTAAGPVSAAPIAVTVDGLVKRYGQRTVLDGLSLDVRAGEVVALLGPNGAGKTTTVEIIEGYRRGDAGTVRVLGSDPSMGGRELRARVGVMLQGGGIDPRAQPRETLRLYGQFHADPRDADELLDLVGLGAAARTRYRRLSGGERQRLGLALALVGEPEVLVLDEPTAGMDPEARARTRSIVGEVRDSGVAILLTSHDLTDVERLADRIVIIDGGRVVAAGTPAELTAGANQRVRFRLDQPLSASEVTALDQVLGTSHPGVVVTVDGDGGRYRLDEANPDPELIAGLARWCASVERLLLEIRTTGGTLEDIYLELVGPGGTGRP
jgi:ABC-2 type transport system ATP-binding protein